jgi:hypothetical protein
MLAEADRELCSFMAQLLVGLVDPGPPREHAGERLLAHYRAYLTDAHPGADPGMLDDMAGHLRRRALAGNGTRRAGPHDRGRDAARLR